MCEFERETQAVVEAARLHNFLGPEYAYNLSMHYPDAPTDSMERTAWAHERLRGTLADLADAQDRALVEPENISTRSGEVEND